MITVSIDNESQLNEVLSIKEVDEIIINRESFDDSDVGRLISKIKNKQKTATLMLETISRISYGDEEKRIAEVLKNEDIDNIVVQNINSLYYIINNIDRKISIIFNYNMNIYNYYSKQYYIDLCNTNKLSYKFVAPVELNINELKKMNFDYIVVYGYLPLMVSKNCIYKNTGQCKRNQYDIIYDRLNKGFRFKSYCSFCYNKIFNTYPIDIRQNEYVMNDNINRRYDFTFETASLIKPIIYNEYDIKDKTNGHYIRAVV